MTNRNTRLSTVVGKAMKEDPTQLTPNVAADLMAQMQDNSHATGTLLAQVKEVIAQLSADYKASPPWISSPTFERESVIFAVRLDVLNRLYERATYLESVAKGEENPLTDPSI